MFVLDTSAVIEILKNTENVKKISSLVKNEKIAITSISYYELLIGEDGDRLQKVIQFLDSLEILNFDKESAIKSNFIYKEMKVKGKFIGKADTLIAGICEYHHLPLITLDKDFKNIKSIEVIMI